MKSILLSIRPEWVCEILNGRKTIEIRRKFPKDYVGWVYIYCTKGKPELNAIDCEHYDLLSDETTTLLNGKVVARFWCDKVEDVIHYNKENYFTEYSGSKVYGGWKDNHAELYNKSCLTLKDFINYVGNKPAYAIHISKLEVFEKPRELSKFYKPLTRETCMWGCEKNCKICECRLTKAPQNYCYIERT